MEIRKSARNYVSVSGNVSSRNAFLLNDFLFYLSLWTFITVREQKSRGTELNKNSFHKIHVRS